MKNIDGRMIKKISFIFLFSYINTNYLDEVKVGIFDEPK